MRWRLGLSRLPNTGLTLWLVVEAEPNRRHADFQFVGEHLRLYFSIGYRDVCCVSCRTMRDFAVLNHAEITNDLGGH